MDSHVEFLESFFLPELPSIFIYYLKLIDARNLSPSHFMNAIPPCRVLSLPEMKKMKANAHANTALAPWAQKQSKNVALLEIQERQNMLQKV